MTMASWIDFTNGNLRLDDLRRWRSARLWLAYLKCIFLAVILGGCSNDPPVPPVSHPFTVVEKSVLRIEELKISEHRAYVFVLKFEFPDGEIPEATRQLLGDGATTADGRFARPGTVVPVKLTIQRKGAESESPVYDKTVPTQGVYSHSSTRMSRLIGFADLRPGVYRVTLENLEPISGLNKTPVKFEIGIPPKSSPLKD